MVDDQSPKQPSSPENANAGWATLSTLTSGLLVWGGIGWLVGAWLGSAIAGIIVGMVIGMTTSLYIIVKKYG